MFRSSVARLGLGVIVALAVLGLLRFKPWQRGGQEKASTQSSTQARQQLAVGFLPVT